MNTRTTILLSFFFLSFSLFAQENTNSLEDQFTDVIKKSNRYEDYKVVKIYKLNNLQKSVLDSVTKLEEEIGSINATVDQQKSELSALTQQLQATQGDLATSKKKEDGIEFFGSITKKSTYNTIMWSIIGLLLFVAIILFFRYKRSNSITRDARSRLTETEEEFELHRQKTLEREQQLRRKLQDEINKNKKPQ